MSKQDHTDVLARLVRKPSRNAVARIGQVFVLNGVPTAVRLTAMDALASMACDESLKILKRVVCDGSLRYIIRRHALQCIAGLLQRAVDCGYSRIGKARIHRLEVEAVLAIVRSSRRRDIEKMRAFNDLVSHLAHALTEGVLGDLPEC